MSWAISCIGTPENVVKYLEKHAKDLDDRSKAEYESVLPHLIAVVKLNFALPHTGYMTPLIDIEAFGSGIWNEKETVYGSCGVSIKPVSKQVV